MVGGLCSFYVFTSVETERIISILITDTYGKQKVNNRW